MVWLASSSNNSVTLILSATNVSTPALSPRLSKLYGRPKILSCENKFGKN